jgi:hypothetical protein
MIALGAVSSGEIIFVVLAVGWLVFDAVRERRRRSSRNENSDAA